MEPDERLYLRVTLRDVEPEIWREFEIDGQMTIRQLHMAIQVMLGWRETHRHETFEGLPLTEDLTPRPPLRWGQPSSDDPEILDEDEWTILGALEESPLAYIYDFGDTWHHLVEINHEMTPIAEAPPVLLRTGRNRGPWEDSGGAEGYQEKCAIWADPDHPEHDEIRQWVADTVGPWAPADPTFFDPPSIQAELNLLFNPSGSGVHPYDMSGLVKADELRPPGDVDLESPIVAFAGTLPPAIRSELRQHLYRTGVLAPTDLDDATAERLIRPFAWLVDAVGAGGIDLTSAGWLPPDVVLDGMTALGWIEDWIGKGNREDLTPPIANLRETAQRLGLVRVQKGRLLLGAEAKKALGHPRRLLRLVARGLYRKLQDAEVDAAVLLFLSLADGTPADERWRTIAFGLTMAGWQHPSGEFDRDDIASVAGRTEDLLGVLFGWRERLTREGSADIALFAREALR